MKRMREIHEERIPSPRSWEDSAAIWVWWVVISELLQDTPGDVFFVFPSLMRSDHKLQKGFSSFVLLPAGARMLLANVG